MTNPENPAQASSSAAHPRYVIYRWLSTDKYMLHGIVPGASVIEAAVDDDIEDIVSQLPDDAFVFHFHLNCTLTARFPRARDELTAMLHEKGILIVNGDLTDISKRTIQRRCAELGLNTTTALPNGDPEELIIVKTNLNFGGDGEWALSDSHRSVLGIAAGSDIIWKPDDYRVLRRREADPSWWSDPSLVCEKYIDNRKNVWYRAMFFFSRVVLRELVSEAQIKKVAQSVITRTWHLTFQEIEAERADADVPRKIVRDILRFAKAFNIDYGALDVMVNDAGEAFIIDVNSTPSYMESPPGWFGFLTEALPSPSERPALSTPPGA